MSSRPKGKPGPDPKWGEPVKRLPLNLPEGLYALLEQHAEGAGVKMSEIIVTRLAAALGYPLLAVPQPRQPKRAAVPGQERLPLLEPANVAA